MIHTVFHKLIPENVNYICSTTGLKTSLRRILDEEGKTIFVNLLENETYIINVKEEKNTYVSY